jgi:hypothetical protein
MGLLLVEVLTSSGSNRSWRSASQAVQEHQLVTLSACGEQSSTTFLSNAFAKYSIQRRYINLNGCAETKDPD